MTLEAWLLANVPSYQPRDKAPISATINGRVVSPDDWAASQFGPSDKVSFVVEPKGSTLESIFRPGPLAKLFGLGNPFAQPKAPTTGNNPGKGRDLELASVKGNQVALNDVIPEIAGRPKRYPDYLLPAHRYFGAPREQWLEMLLCIGKGEYEVPASKILVGDTPIISLGADASYKIYNPGADLSAEPIANWWHSAPEIGATSGGTAGLELTTTQAVDPVARASSYIFSGDTVTIVTGAGSFPSSWQAGMIARVVVNYPYAIEDGVGTNVRDIIKGDIAQLGLKAGDTIEIAGDNPGQYVVHAVDNTAGTLTLNYPDGSPATALVTGSVNMSIGFRGSRYRLTGASASTLALVRLTSSGAEDLEWPGFSDRTTDTAIITLDQSTQEGDWTGPFAACPEGEVTSSIEWDVFFPAGLIYIGPDGWIAPSWSATVELQYRDMATAGAWSSVVRTYSNRTTDQIGYTERINFGSAIRPEVRMRRIGAKAVESSTQDGVQWYGLRSLLKAPKSYSGATVMAVRLRGGERLATQSETLVSVTPTRILPIRENGQWLPPRPTRDLAPWLAYVAKSIGYSDEDLDLAELDRLDSVWKARGDYFDLVISTPTTVKRALADCLQAGFADFTIDRGLIRPVRDEPRTVMEHPYTPQNMTKPLTRQFAALKPDDFDGVDVEYTDGRTWQKETVECRLPGDAGLRVEKLKLNGVTGRTQAWRIGMRRRMEQKYRRWSYSFGTELDALNSRYLSYVPLQDDVPGYGQSALMLSYHDGIIESSEPFDWSAGGAHVVGIRRPDGTLSGPYPATQIDEYRLSITDLDFEPDTSWSIEPPHLLFGPVNRWSYPALITSISPSGTDGASVEATNYSDRVYEYDDAFPPST